MAAPIFKVVPSRRGWDGGAREACLPNEARFWSVYSYRWDSETNTHSTHGWWVADFDSEVDARLFRLVKEDSWP